MVEMSKRLKDVHPNFLILYKSGTFYKTFGKDAYIIGAMFDYNVHIVNQNIPTCGFPMSAEKRVRAKLEENKINYKIVDPRNEYSVDVSEDYKNLNEYENELKKDFTLIKYKKIINRITEELTMNMNKPDFKDIIRKIEDILDETGKI